MGPKVLQQQGNPFTRIIAFSFFPIIALLSLFFYTSCSNNSNTNSTRLVTGETGVLDNGSDHIPIGTTEPALDALTKAASSNDTIGYDNLLANKSVYLVDKGTHALFLDRGSLGVWHVRIVDGAHATEEGWILMEWIKKP